MPTYEYKWRDCNQRFEKFQSINDKPLEKCPKCGGTVQRLISSGSGVIFKGAGFYANDYAKKNRITACGNEKPCCAGETTCSKNAVK